jgi:hypothetical protein
VRIETCSKCQRPFGVTSTGDYPFRDPEQIICPHCGAHWGTELIRGDFHTTPLTPEQERAYAAKTKLP